MIAKFSPLLQKELIRIQKKEGKLAVRIQKQIQIFEENPKHPSLRTHKLSGNYTNMWGISITMSIRIIFLQLDDKIALFVKIGTHDELYRQKVISTKPQC
jgi:addiction module RelE/StbE family toxin